MSVLYHPDKVNVVEDALSRLSISSIAHVEEDKKELVCDIHRLTRLVKSQQGLDPILIEFKEVVLKNSVDAFSQGGDGVLKYQCRLCVPNVDDLRDQILSEGNSSRYSIHPVATNMYCNLREVYLWNGMKKDIAEFVAKCPRCQQVKDEHQKLGGLELTREAMEKVWLIRERLKRLKVDKSPMLMLEEEILSLM
ncbi:hypothetical protein MTR67_002906 [Solanum verrucosum]|uniref:Integrase zinc-binding domain-containing protein n=1 Tax=Solanum verrucosum TaxID=315347 RepID=A0AAF0PVR5_SOLVR|nr:hypothetical protein MTR67_002906 [Solanum verrucosum]